MTESVMRLSEPVTIYLAAGASFGVSRYLCAVGYAKSRRRAVAEGIAAALLWPIAAAAILIKQLRHVHEKDGRGGQDARVHARVEEASRTFIISVNKMLETLRALRMTAERETVEQTLYALREGAEQYVGLTRMDADADEYAKPAAYEGELARISGRRGADLVVAARCVHRRNVSRIKAHYRRERSRLLRKLAELRSEEDSSLSSKRDEGCSAGRREMSEARLEIYLRAADLFSLLEDERAARSATLLIDAECLTLRRLREKDEAATRLAYGEERCTDRSPQLMSKDPLRATTFMQG